MIDVRDEYVKTLRAIPDTVRALVAGVDDETSRTRPEPDEWALVEIVAHMADVDERALGRIRRMLAEDNPVLEPFDQDQLAIDSRYIERSLPSEVERLADTRREHLDLLASLDEAGWQRPGRHGEHGQITVENYEAHCAAEDVDHLAQIARTLSAVRS